MNNTELLILELNCLKLYFSNKHTIQFIKWIKIKKIKNGCIVCSNIKINKNNYYDVRINGFRSHIHRYIYQLYSHKKLKNHDFICHKCNNRKCININHLYLGNRKTNSQDMVDCGHSLKGIKNPKNKLNIKDVRDIIKKSNFHVIKKYHPRSSNRRKITYLKRKYTLNKLSEMYGVSRQHIIRIINKETWKHIR